MKLVWLTLTFLTAGTEEVIIDRPKPEPVSMSAPTFPKDLPPHEEDIVGVVRCTVGADGTVVHAQMEKSIGVREDAAVLEAAYRWIFKPAIQKGQAIESMIDVPVHIETHPEASSVESPTPQAQTLQTVVRGKAEPSPPAGVGDIDITLGEISNVPRSNASKLLTLAPGVLLTNHGGEGHAPKVFLRGFDAGEGKDIEVTLQGVPLNAISHSHGHGYADTNLIIPDVVSRLRVTEGNLHPSQGDFSVAGSVNYQLGVRERGAHVRAEYGAFEEQRVVGHWAPVGLPDATFLAAQFKQGAGYGLSRAHSSSTFLGQHELLTTESTRLRLLGGFTAGRFASAGVIRADDLAQGTLPCGASTRDQFFCTYDPDQGGAQQHHLLALDHESRVGQSRMGHQAFLVGRNMRIRENFTGFLYDLPAPGESQRGDNTELTYGGHTFGIKGFYRPAPFENVSWELGYLARHDDVKSTSRRRRAQTGIPYRIVFDNDIRVTNLAVYGQAQWNVSKKLQLRGGLRLDSFFFNVQDNNRPLSDREGARLASDRIDAYGMVPSPRASMEYALTDQLSWLTGGGLGARSSDASALSESEFAPFARVYSAETGLRFRRKTEALELEVRASGYGTHVTQDFVFDEVAGRNQPVGPSSRLGAMALTRLAGEWFDVQGNVAYAYASLAPSQNAPWQPWAWNALPYAPRWLGRLDAATWKRWNVGSQKVKTTLALGGSYIGPRPLPFNEFASDIVLVDGSASVRWKALEFGASVENLFDTLWREAEFNYVSNFDAPSAAPSRMSMRHFSAGSPRIWRLFVAFHFGAGDSGT